MRLLPFLDPQPATSGRIPGSFGKSCQETHAMRELILLLPFLLASAFILYVGMDSMPFAAWNLMPIVLGYLTARIATRRRGLPRVLCSLFAGITLLIPTLFHLAWIADWHGTATNSSTAGIAFVTIPIVSIVVAAVASFVPWFIAAIISLHRD